MPDIVLLLPLGSFLRKWYATTRGIHLRSTPSTPFREFRLGWLGWLGCLACGWLLLLPLGSFAGEHQSCSRLLRRGF